MSIKDGKSGDFSPIGPIGKIAQEALDETVAELNEASVKETNPKDAIGVTKTPLSTVPAAVMLETGLAMLEGSCKYGRHNYRFAGVRASVYYDAVMRHAMEWWEGTDLDNDSGLSHITKAIATLVVLRDAMLNDMMHDDRPIGMVNPNWLKEMNERTKAILEKYPNPKEPYLAKDYKRVEE